MVYFIGPFACCNFMHHLFWKVFCNMLISKLHSLGSVFNTVYVLILEQLLLPKDTVFFVFAACYKRPLSRSYVNHHAL